MCSGCLCHKMDTFILNQQREVPSIAWNKEINSGPLRLLSAIFSVILGQVCVCGGALTWSVCVCVCVCVWRSSDLECMCVEEL